jgi:hypothetical protein
LKTPAYLSECYPDAREHSKGEAAEEDVKRRRWTRREVPYGLYYSAEDEENGREQAALPAGPAPHRFVDDEEPQQSAPHHRDLVTDDLCRRKHRGVKSSRPEPNKKHNREHACDEQQ